MASGFTRRPTPKEKAKAKAFPIRNDTEHHRSTSMRGGGDYSDRTNYDKWPETMPKSRGGSKPAGKRRSARLDPRKPP